MLIYYCVHQERVGEYSTDMYNITNLILIARRRSVVRESALRRGIETRWGRRGREEQMQHSPGPQGVAPQNGQEGWGKNHITWEGKPLTYDHIRGNWATKGGGAPWYLHCGTTDVIWVVSFPHHSACAHSGSGNESIIWVVWTSSCHNPVPYRESRTCNLFISTCACYSLVCTYLSVAEESTCPRNRSSNTRYSCV